MFLGSWLRLFSVALAFYFAIEYIDIIIKCTDNDPLSDFSLDNLYFDDISYNGIVLTPGNAEKEIQFSAFLGYPVNREIIHVNSK